MDTLIVVGVAALVVVWMFVAAWRSDRKMAQEAEVRAALLQKSRNIAYLHKLEIRVAQLERELAALADDNEILRAQVNFSREPA